MDSAFIEEMKELLYKERKEILDRMNTENSSFKTEGATGRGDSVDLASDEGAFKKMEALNAMDAKRLTAVENALKRISENKYGICLKCGKAVVLPGHGVSTTMEAERRTNSFLNLL